METVMKVPHATKAVIGCGVLYVLISFFSWQSHSFGEAGTYAQPLWHGLGLLTALAAVAYLGWELARALGVEVTYDSVSSPLISAAGGGLVLFLNLIVFLTWGEYRTWAAWVGILLALGIGGAATWRARSEGVQLPGLPEGFSLGSRELTVALPRTQAAEVATEPAPLQEPRPVEA